MSAHKREELLHARERLLRLLQDAYSADALEAARAAEAEAEAAGTREEAAMLLVGASLAHVLACQFDVAARTAQRATALDRSSVTLAARAMTAALIGASEPGSVPDPRTLLRRTVDPGDLLLVRFLLAEEAMARGDFVEVRRLVDDVSDESGTVLDAAIRLLRVRALVFEGRLDDADAVSSELAPVLVGYPRLAVLLRAFNAFIAAERGERARCERLATEVLTQVRGDRNYVAVGSCLVLAWAFRDLGRLQQAAALIMAAAGGPTMPWCKLWDRVVAIELLVTAALRRGDVGAASRLLDVDADLERHPAALAALRRAQSRLASVSGDSAGAVSHAREAMRLDRRSGGAIEALRSRLLSAQAVLADDPARAAVQLRELAVEASALGAESIRADASRLWRRIEVGDRGPGGPELFSPREFEIASLVAEGASDRDIAAVLFLSVRTVESHLANVLRVLGVRTRVEVAARLSRSAGAPPQLTALTPAQRRVAEAAATGVGNLDLARQLGISVKTVESHLSAIYTRLGVRSRAGLVGLLGAVTDR